MLRIMSDGADTENRTKVKTRSLFGVNLSFDLSKGFPAVTTKKLHFKSVAAELLWFLSGSKDVKDLQAMGCHIWDANVAAWESKHKNNPSDAGMIYGNLWRQWDYKHGNVHGTVDQIHKLLFDLRNNPTSRRLIVTAWEPGAVAENMVALPACHILFQCHVHTNNEGNKVLSMGVYQRSADFFLGVPFNIASYALLTHILAVKTGMVVGKLWMNFGDAHIYHNHFGAVREQLSRASRTLPWLEINDAERGDYFDYPVSAFRLVDYNPHPAINADMAV